MDFYSMNLSSLPGKILQLQLPVYFYILATYYVVLYLLFYFWNCFFRDTQTPSMHFMPLITSLIDIWFFISCLSCSQKSPILFNWSLYRSYFHFAQLPLIQENMKSDFSFIFPYHCLVVSPIPLRWLLFWGVIPSRH